MMQSSRSGVTYQDALKIVQIGARSCRKGWGGQYLWSQDGKVMLHQPGGVDVVYVALAADEEATDWEVVI
jgi:hypothetical protein